MFLSQIAGALMGETVFLSICYSMRTALACPVSFVRYFHLPCNSLSMLYLVPYTALTLAGSDKTAHACAGCFIAPLTFQMFWRSFPIGVPSSEYIAPYANIYRGMAVIGTQVCGFNSLLNLQERCDSEDWHLPGFSRLAVHESAPNK